MDSKDSFWNCENVEVYDSIIVGEYLGWNSKNVKFVNCTIDSHQGMCYMKNIKMENCKLLNTDLCFELCEDIDANIWIDLERRLNNRIIDVNSKKVTQIQENKNNKE